MFSQGPSSGEARRAALLMVLSLGAKSMGSSRLFRAGHTSWWLRVVVCALGRGTHRRSCPPRLLAGVSSGNNVCIQNAGARSGVGFLKVVRTQWQ